MNEKKDGMPYAPSHLIADSIKKVLKQKQNISIYDSKANIASLPLQEDIIVGLRSMNIGTASIVQVFILE